MSDCIYIYMLRDPRDPKALVSARYVGASANPEARLRGHLGETRRDNPVPVYEWMRALGRAPAMDVLWITSREGAADAEQSAIAGLRKLGAALLNGTVGGDALEQWGDPEYRERVSKATSEHMRHQWRDPEFRERMRIALAAQWTPARRARMSKAVSESNRRRARRSAPRALLASTALLSKDPK